MKVSPSRRTALVAVASMLAVPSAFAAGFSDYQWKKRPIVIFAPSDSDPRLLRQRNAINGARTAFLDRDVVVIYIIGGVVTHDLGPSPGMSAAALRSYFKASEGSGFRMLLIGKDGGLKLDSSVPLSASEFFNEIDRMPMRRDEVRRRTREGQGR